MKLDFINGNHFEEISDFVIDFDTPSLDYKLFSKNSIVFVKTDFLFQFFNFIQFSRRKYILITHLSDYPINEYRFKQASENIVKWYAENAIYENSKLISIPLGLENHYGASKGKFTNHEWFVKNIDSLKNTPKDCAIYCNWNINTNQEIRGKILEKLQANDMQICFQCGLSFEDYCEHMCCHQFVVCPPGNGVDTHRLWEALYMGCYPITLKHRIYDNYDLPILQVNDWSEINNELLENFFIKWNIKRNNDQLNMSWWTNLIKQEFNSL